MLRAVTVFIFLALAAENYADVPFGGHWETMFRFIGEFLYRASWVKAPTIAVILMLLLAAARGQPGAQTGRVAALDRMIWLNFWALAGMFLYGMLGGGNLMSAMLQTQVMLFLPFAAFLFTAALRTESELRAAGLALLWAAFYRGFLVLYFAWVVAPELHLQPATMTTHGDTILFASAIAILGSHALEAPTRMNVLRAAVLIAVMLVVIQVNNRRLAYVCVGGCTAVLFLLYDDPKLKRLIRRRLLQLSPLIALYVIVGWGSDSRIFKPVKAISSLAGKHQDTSSQTRDIENYNLIVTLKPHILAGVGWGHEYNEVSVAYSISEFFPLYRYIPHNSLLGLWAFTGYIGATAWWLCLVVAAFLAVRAYKFAKQPTTRTICAVAVCEIVIYMLQGYGDMGLDAWQGSLTLALAFAAASRMAAATGAFPARSGAGAGAGYGQQRRAAVVTRALRDRGSHA